MCITECIDKFICISICALIKAVFCPRRISYMEIYNEAMCDLLSTLPESVKATQLNTLTIAEDEQGVYVKGLQSHVVQNEEEALNLLFEVTTYFGLLSKWVR